MDLCWLTDSWERVKSRNLKLILRNGAKRNVILRRLQSVSQVMKKEDKTLPKKTIKGHIKRED
jgi:hypothetical protein